MLNNFSVKNFNGFIEQVDVVVALVVRNDNYSADSLAGSVQTLPV